MNMNKQISCCRAEAEHQEYRRSAMLSGRSLDDTDEEWEEQKQAIVYQKTAKSMNKYTPHMKSRVWVV